jgi:hypothetical protein
MRRQMFRTMRAAEGAFEAISAHLSSHNTTNSPDYGANPPGTDYSTLLAECGKCLGVVHIINCKRNSHSPEDTCNCDVGLEDLLVPPDVKAFYSMGRGPKGDRGVPGPSVDLTEINKRLDQHDKALSIIGVFGGFENVSFGQTEPGRMVRSLVGFSVCRECVGTGWLARDESCTNCKKGYTKP